MHSLLAGLEYKNKTAVSGFVSSVVRKYVSWRKEERVSKTGGGRGKGRRGGGWLVG